MTLGFIDDDYSSSDAYLGTTCDFSENFEPYGLWCNLSVDHNAYDPSKSKSSFLRDPVLKCVHRFLAYNFLGKKDQLGVGWFVLRCGGCVMLVALLGLVLRVGLIVQRTWAAGCIALPAAAAAARW